MWRSDLTAAATINASCLALLNSGSVHMRGIVAALFIGRLPDGTLVVDPDRGEEKSLGGGEVHRFLITTPI